MRVVIIEDEILAAQRLQLLLKQADPSIKVVAMLGKYRGISSLSGAIPN